MVVQHLNMCYIKRWDFSTDNPHYKAEITEVNMKDCNVIIEGSARHVHLSPADFKTLFGADAVFHQVRELSQPGQFLSEEKVTLEGPKGKIERVSVLGPERSQSQVELSFTDARILGLTPPVRESGDLAGSAPVRLIGPAGSVDLAEGSIIAKRHIHITPEEAAEYGLKDKEIVQVKVGGDRGMIFDEVVVRVSSSYRFRMHVDYDEINAAHIEGKDPLGCVLKK
jgi:putative phosphotransacetylase